MKKYIFAMRPAWNQFLEWFTPQIGGNDEQKLLQTRIINTIIWGSIVFIGIVMIGNMIDGNVPTFVQMLDLVGCLILLQFSIWLHRGRLKLALVGVAIFGLVFLTVITASLGTILSSATPIFTFWVLMMGIMFDLRGIVWGSIGASLAVLALMLAEQAQWLPAPMTTVGISDWITYTILFAFAGGLTYYIHLGTKKALVLAQTEVAQRKKAEIQLRAIQDQLQGMLDALPDPLLELGRNGVIHDYRPSRVDILAAPSENVLGRHLSEFLPALAVEGVMHAIGEAARQGQSTGTICALQCRNGTIWFELSVAAKPGSTGQNQRFICLARDTTRRQQAEDALLASEARYRILADVARDVVWSVRSDGAVSFISAAVQTVLGFVPADILHKKMDSMFAPTSFGVWENYVQQIITDCQTGKNPQSFRREIECLRRDGSLVWTDVTAHPTCNETGLVEVIGVSRDITEHKRLVSDLQQARDTAEEARHALQGAYEELSKVAVTDPLTGVYNRRHANRIAKTEIALAHRYDALVSLILFDIDHFKSINDTYGHPVGDIVLIEMSKLVSMELRQIDIFARWGGEEFVVILPQCSLSDAIPLAEKIRTLIASHSFAKVHTVTVSLGVAEYQRDEQLEGWIHRVDQALYEAKRSGRNRVCIAAKESWNKENPYQL